MSQQPHTFTAHEEKLISAHVARALALHQEAQKHPDPWAFRLEYAKKADEADRAAGKLEVKP